MIKKISLLFALFALCSCSSNNSIDSLNDGSHDSSHQSFSSSSNIDSISSQESINSISSISSVEYDENYQFIFGKSFKMVSSVFFKGRYGDQLPVYNYLFLSFDYSLNATFTWQYENDLEMTLIYSYTIVKETPFNGRYFILFSNDSRVAPRGFEIGFADGKWRFSSDFESISYFTTRVGVAVTSDGQRLDQDINDRAEFVVIDD